MIFLVLLVSLVCDISSFAGVTIVCDISIFADVTIV